MRRVVPFIGEQQIARADTELERAKRSSGRVIDEVVGSDNAESSWDDIVKANNPEGHDELKPHQSSVGVSLPTPPAKGKSIVKTSVKYTPGPAGKSSAPDTRSTTFVHSSMPTLDWVPINSGRGLRISISGNIDHNLRSEWNRLLEETEGNGAGEFEFNLTQTPSLSLTGLGMLLLFKERKASKRDAIRLCHCTKEVSQLLHWTGMDKYFVILSDQQHDL